jgi:hypothetical protein
VGNKTIYVKDEGLWERAKRLAGKEGLSSFVGEALAAHVEQKEGEALGVRKYALRVGPQRIQIHGRRLGQRRFVYCPSGHRPDEQPDAPTTTVDAEVYRTRSGKLILVKRENAQVVHVEELTHSYWTDVEVTENHFECKSLLDVREQLKECPQGDVADFLDDLSRELGEDWAVVIE